MPEKVLQPKEVSLEEVKSALNLWRQNKRFRLERTPDHIRALIKQLSLKYTKYRVSQALGIGSDLVNEVCKLETSGKVPLQSKAFIPFRLVPRDKGGDPAPSSNNTLLQPALAAPARLTKFEISNLRNAKLTIYSSDIATVIKAFICCS